MGENVVQFPGRGGEVAALAEDARWQVDIEYRSEAGGELRTHYIEELAELDALIEGGPHWDTLIKCVVTLNRPSGDIPRMTKEQAELL